MLILQARVLFTTLNSKGVLGECQEPDYYLLKNCPPKGKRFLLKVEDFKAALELYL